MIHNLFVIGFVILSNRNKKIALKYKTQTNIDEIISDVESFEPNSIIDKKYFLKILHDFKNNKIHKAHNIFKMYSFSLWCSQFKVYE